MTPEEIVIVCAKKYRDAFRDYEVFRLRAGGGLEKHKVREAREALFAALDAVAQ